MTKTKLILAIGTILEVGKIDPGVNNLPGLCPSHLCSTIAGKTVGFSPGIPPACSMW